MSDKKEDNSGRRAILGYLGSVFMPRSRSSATKNTPRFDLTKCQFYESSVITFVFISAALSYVLSFFFLSSNNGQ